jgi:hypothetical protein
VHCGDEQYAALPQSALLLANVDILFCASHGVFALLAWHRAEHRSLHIHNEVQSGLLDT